LNIADTIKGARRAFKIADTIKGARRAFKIADRGCWSGSAKTRRSHSKTRPGLGSV